MKLQTYSKLFVTCFAWRRIILRLHVITIWAYLLYLLHLYFVKIYLAFTRVESKTSRLIGNCDFYSNWSLFMQNGRQLSIDNILASDPSTVWLNIGPQGRRLLPSLWALLERDRGCTVSHSDLRVPAASADEQGTTGVSLIRIRHAAVVTINAVSLWVSAPTEREYWFHLRESTEAINRKITLHAGCKFCDKFEHVLLENTSRIGHEFMYEYKIRWTLFVVFVWMLTHRVSKITFFRISYKYMCIMLHTHIAKRLTWMRAMLSCWYRLSIQCTLVDSFQLDERRSRERQQ